jgi:AcrR family transcriptional regulator
MGRSDRVPLSRERIAAAAVALIDGHGADALSMRKLGAELGVEAMSLYNHVSSKADLVDLVGEQIHTEILTEIGELDPAHPWRDRARRIAYAYRTVALRHPHAFMVSIERPVSGVAGMKALYLTYETFRQAGMSEELAGLAFGVAGSWLHGAVTQELGLMAELRQGEGFQADDVPPELAGVVEFKEACLTWSDEDRFAAGLDVLLAGFETLLVDGGRFAGPDHEVGPG